MAIRSNHYDAAFEEFLRERRVPYVAVDEKRRAVLADSSIKSFDFIVEATGQNLLVDVKGRIWGQSASSRGQAGSSENHKKSSNRYWENWATEDDIGSMLRWEGVFGDQFRAALVFAYAIETGTPVPPSAKRDGAELFEFCDRTYFFSAVTVQDYASFMKPRSAGWGTVTVPAADFRSHRQPLEKLLSVATAVDCEQSA